MDTSDDPFAAPPAVMPTIDPLFAGGLGKPGAIGLPTGIPSVSQVGTSVASIKKATTGFGKYGPLIAASIVGSLEASAILQTGRDAESIAAQRAAVDRANAAQVRVARVERAKIMRERAEILKAKQTKAFISGGIKTNVGVPLLVAAQTDADVAADIGFNLESGRVETRSLLASAEIEEDIGRKKRKQSRLDAIGAFTGRTLPFIGLNV